MARRTLLLVAVAAAAGVLATTAATRGGTGAGSPPAATVPTGTVRVISTTLTSRQQVNGTLGYAPPMTVVAAHGSARQEVAQARASMVAARAALDASATDQTRAQYAAASAALRAMVDSEAIPAGTLTWLPAVGATVVRGQNLYEVGDQPVPLFYGAQPLYRHLAAGCSGEDVREVEDNLLALGFGTPVGLVADGNFTTADAAAVRAWQAAIRAPVTGEIDLGALVMLPAAVRVAALHGALGGAYAPGQPVLDVTDTAHVVTVDLDTTLAAGVKVGDTVTVQLPGAGTPATGKVTAVSAAAQAPNQQQGQGGPLRATLPVTVHLDDPAAGGALDQVPVRVSITDQVRRNVLAVPVTALVARSDGTFAVLLVKPSGRVPVTVRMGIFGDGGLVEVSGAGLAAGDLVEVPQAL
jgi:hypothetical protein